MYTFVATIAKIILRLFGKIEVRNKELLPTEGGYIIACNHRGWVEIIVLGTKSPKPVHFMAKKELFTKRLIGWFLTSIKAFPVNRENPSPGSIKKPVKLLKEGHVVGIFPSGTRTAEDASLKRGAVTIANLAKMPIVPAIYEGPGTLKGLWKTRKATLTFGEPFYVSSKNKDELAAFTERLSRSTNEINYLNKAQ
ncbi:1-acylglycerol-3-phosphate O-acyltransferase [Fictibacillus macauensis ZFHKF-1]|uniref:1-acyl-sn-glycerol-3-phosphate acyltransferase n=1 Tax=Fictibacillus macauensis ZFHKF-1 TaxID=1196324 RepID=I8UAD0_9BACL|nr:lysophospholipid acyltransferase family protein [Fictibacillus macauensis]EIT83905.1 1-acylglycerol-3-phosphate O-acyltransferase [Fictibacillus macauensis ZFHKF-1]